MGIECATLNKISNFYCILHNSSRSGEIFLATRSSLCIMRCVKVIDVSLADRTLARNPAVCPVFAAATSVQSPTQSVQIHLKKLSTVRKISIPVVRPCNGDKTVSPVNVVVVNVLICQKMCYFCNVRRLIKLNGKFTALIREMSCSR